MFRRKAGFFEHGIEPVRRCRGAFFVVDIDRCRPDEEIAMSRGRHKNTLAHLCGALEYGRVHESLSFPVHKQVFASSGRDLKFIL